MPTGTPVPVLAITSGEPAGIGPDLCLALAGKSFPARLVVLADRELLAHRAARLNFHGALRDYDAAAKAPPPGILEVLHCPLAVPARPGVLDPANGAYVLALLDRALAGCQSGEFDAMVTAPVHKGVINDAGVPFTGHTEYLAEHTATPRVVMMLAGQSPLGGHRDASGRASVPGPLRVALATTHLPLRAVPEAITPALLTEVITILHQDLHRKWGIAAPRILVSGLNPHAGEGGHMGREEVEVIEPTLARLRQQGFDLIGPLPADTLFTPPQLARGDAVLAMYHDQGLAALKFATFGHGINITLGLPILRTSVDHGTALDLAGTGRADPGSLYAAVSEALLVCRQGQPA